MYDIVLACTIVASNMDGNNHMGPSTSEFRVNIEWISLVYLE